jgi:hypothetical protein
MKPGPWVTTTVALGVVLCIQVLAAAGQAARRGAASCRTGMATYRIVTKSTVTSTVNGTCTFDPATVEGTCTNEYSDSTGRRFRTTSVTRHASVTDVVDEVAVNPPRQRALSTTTTVTGAGPDSVNTSTLEYDAERRLTSITAESRPSGQRAVTTYTTWDAAGRPTMGSAVPGRAVQTLSYDDARRTQTMSSAGVTCTQTFDENGNPSIGTCPASVATTTVLTTMRVCR